LKVRPEGRVDRLQKSSTFGQKGKKLAGDASFKEQTSRKKKGVGKKPGGTKKPPGAHDS